MAWVYEPDENPKRKHRWSHNCAGFEEMNGVPVGKCPNNLTNAECGILLNKGIAWTPDRWPKKYPKRIYNIHDSVVYRATPTIGGVSYHAFPETGGHFPGDLAEALLDLADQLGCRKEIRKWLGQ